MVSVVIPTYNAGHYLPKLIPALKKQTLEHELIIIDSESTDDSAIYFKENSIPYTSIDKISFNHGATRNLGLKLSSSNIVVFLTQDALPADQYTLERLVNCLEKDERIAMAYGRQLPYDDTDVFGRFARLANYPAESLLKDKSLISKLGIKTCSCSNSFAVYKKDLMELVSLFPDDTILGEDVTVAAKFILSGYAISYCAEAQVFHSHTYSISEEFGRYFDIGVFHRQQNNVLKYFNGAESEGLRYVLQESKFLIQNKAFQQLPMQLLRTIAKFAGYKLGFNYQQLPKRLKVLFSMHKSFWK
ncbi:rhamnosyltransferase [Spirosoma lacussanchae]|uniref:glycosyltransferase family 2 protein n=1 Tax=Spirosoma lacussanchae TaxID=1884249 RepID=UPI001107F9D8|nr:glycosyltransferase family 2 protein [Spirosoma lacussanchae]